jgi:hypothetical protein
MATLVNPLYLFSISVRHCTNIARISDQGEQGLRHRACIGQQCSPAWLSNSENHQDGRTSTCTDCARWYGAARIVLLPKEGARVQVWCMSISESTRPVQQCKVIKLLMRIGLSIPRVKRLHSEIRSPRHPMKSFYNWSTLTCDLVWTTLQPDISSLGLCSYSLQHNLCLTSSHSL